MYFFFFIAVCVHVIVLADNIYVYFCAQINTNIYTYVCMCAFTCVLCLCSEPSNLLVCAGQLILPRDVALKPWQSACLKLSKICMKSTEVCQRLAGELLSFQVEIFFFTCIYTSIYRVPVKHILLNKNKKKN